MNYEKHLYQSERLKSVLEEILNFFESTPSLELVNLETFPGSGVYALYYTGNFELYKGIPPSRPIYVGKAVPKGWRQARQGSDNDPQLYFRLKQHIRSINIVNNLNINDFKCRFVIFGGVSVDLIGSVESALFRKYRPLWNVEVDGFGNHDPGKGRYDQAPSEWDVLHPGRPWVKKLTGTSPNIDDIIQKINQYIANLS